MPDKITFRTAYGPRHPVNLSFKGVISLTKQSFRKDCDINSIMAKFVRDGLLEHVNEHQGQYGDYAGIQDYHSSMNQVLAAQSVFLELPAKIREKFQNDPGQFLAFTEDEKNQEAMVEMGLATARTPTAPVEPPKAKADPKSSPAEPKEPSTTAPKGP